MGTVRRLAEDVGWHCRSRRQGNLGVDPELGDLVTTGERVAGSTERHRPTARLFGGGGPTNLGIPREAGHPEPWILAMDCPPTRAAVRDDGRRWSIEPLFSELKSRGFDPEASHRAPRIAGIASCRSWPWPRTRASAPGKKTPAIPRSRRTKNSKPNRSGPLELSKARLRRFVLVRARSAVAPETAANATAPAVLLSSLLGDEERIGGERW